MNDIQFHQSMLQSYSRCAAAFGLERSGAPRATNSAAVYGTVVHDALQFLETQRANGEPFEKCVLEAQARFIFFWNPKNIEQLTDPVPPDGWLPKQGYMDLRVRGVEALKAYSELIRYDDHQVLNVEHSFVVPIHGTWDDDLGQPHTLAGSVDRLAVRHWKGKPFIAIDDYKTGQSYKYLRQNVQFSAYCYASTQKEFWTGADGEEGFGEERGTELFEKFKDYGRRGTWINMRSYKYEDAGWRGPIDYHRFAVAVDQLYNAIKHDVYPLSISGDTCKFCDHRKTCAGTGIAPDTHGQP